jgi:hypothetical protein
MIRLKDLLNENTGNKLLDTILNSTQPLINGLIKKYKEEKEKEGGKWTKFDTEYTTLNLQFDLIKAIEKYTKPTDKLVSTNIYGSKKGALTVSAKIERDGTTYQFNTEAIYAGGYNIQQLHFRYITKTNLPQTGNSTETQRVKAELNKMSKGDKLQKEIQFNQARIERLQKELDTNSKVTDKQILNLLIKGDPSKNEDPLKIYTWNDIVKNGADKNYNNSKDEFEKRQKEYVDSKIHFWKKQNVEWKRREISTAKELIQKTQKKLDSLV